MGACNACNVKGQDELNELTCPLRDQGESVEKPQPQPQPKQERPSTPNQVSAETQAKAARIASQPRLHDEGLPNASGEDNAQEQCAETTTAECSAQPATPAMQPEEGCEQVHTCVAPSAPICPQEWTLMPSVGTWYLSRQTKWIEAARSASKQGVTTAGSDKFIEESFQAAKPAAHEEVQPECVVSGGVAVATKMADSCEVNVACGVPPEVIKPAFLQDVIHGAGDLAKRPWARMPSVATWVSSLPALDREAAALKEVATLVAKAEA